MRGFLIAIALLVFAPPAFAERIQLSDYASGTGLLAIRIEIDGRPGRLLFDTGGGVSLVTPQYGATFACTPYGSFTGFRMRGDRVDTQKCGEHSLRIGQRMVRREVGVFDLMALLGEGAPPIDGVMGLDVLDGHLVTLSLADRRLYVDERPGHGWSEGVARFQREAGGAGLSIFVRVEAARGPLWMLLDSGSVGAYAYLSPGAVAQLGHSGDGPVTLNITGAGAQSMSFQRIDPLIYDGVLGERFLRKYDIAVDFRSSRIWWRRRPEPH
ncbi:hypothetical protein [Terricaulis sp.]|uniref:hypothetical protein n=1 Tax=Terricaulis sp. TaxID=2768686 RepID=UPI0037839649